MLKLVVLSALLAAAAAEPLAPFAFSTVLAPASTSITRQASSVVHPSPYYPYYSAPTYYSAPLAYSHLIKKRSAPLLSSYIAPSTYSYIARAPLTTHAIAAPLSYHASLWSAPLAYSAPAHFIKKRSAPLALSSYFAPYTYSYATTTPLVASTYATAPLVHAAPLLSPAPITYSHLIKKRSATLIAPYIAPAAAYSHQSRIDVKHTSPVFTTYTTPLVYSKPIIYSRFF